MRIFYRLKIGLRFGIGVLLLLPAISAQYAPPQVVLPEPHLAVHDYPKDYFQNPVDDAIKIAGTFGELRPDHFHSGLDIKSKTGGIGQPIRAAAEGYIAKIKVQSDGYGNVLYIRHPNGYTTVYAHLDKFSKEVEQYVKAQQYKRERFEVSLSLPATQFKVKSGQIIGAMGNSGSSDGAHLHFEIRNTSTEKALNPELFGLPVSDNTPPEIRDMKVYVLDENRAVLKEMALPVVRATNGQWRLKNGDTLRVGAARVGFGVKVFDKMGGLPNDNGIYALTQLVDGQKNFEWRMENLSFSETRYLNAHADYGARERYGAWFHRCFVLPGDKMSNYTETAEKGAVTLSTQRAIPVKITAIDASGNASSVGFYVVSTDVSAAIYSDTYNLIFRHGTAGAYESGGFKISMPAGALYEDLRFHCGVDTNSKPGVYAPVYSVHYETVPVHKSFELRIKPSKLPESLRKKAVIARIESGRPVNCGGVWNEEMLVAKVREFGKYSIMADNTAPTLTPVVFDRDMRKKSNISFRVRDNFATGGQARGIRYRGTIDGKWVLFEFDEKRNRLTYNFDENVGAGEHTLRLVVTDDRGNAAVVEKKFLR